MLSKTPKCRTCENMTIEADAGIMRSIPYLYCRKCKIEVNFWGYPLDEAKPVKKEVFEERLVKADDVAKELLDSIQPYYFPGFYAQAIQRHKSKSFAYQGAPGAVSYGGQGSIPQSLPKDERETDIDETDWPDGHIP